MRRSNPLIAAGGPRRRTFGARCALVTTAVMLGTVWAAYTYAQEAYVGHKLTQQVSDLRRQNALIAAQNQGYHKDIQAITSGSADEEEARLNGYSRPQEKVYLVTPTPSPTPPTPSPSVHPSP